MKDDLDDLRALLPAMPLEVLDLLGGSTRSRVRRVRGDQGTMIVKEFLNSGDGWVRESAALSVMPSAAPAPHLLTAGAAPPLVVMSDAGTGASVADALLGPDPAAAADAVVAWAEAIAGLHLATAGLRDAFRDSLATRAGDLPVPESTVPDDLDAAARFVDRYCAELGVEVPAHALDELRGLDSRLSGGRAALTPADACPDNNVSTGDGLVLIDFEGAQWRHVAWDLAYLAVPWPTCWCSWRIPTGVATRAIDAYRARVGSPYVAAPEFRADLAAAVTGWVFVSTSWLLPKALLDDPPMGDPGRPVPTRRALILHRLEQVRGSAGPLALAELADRLHAVLTARWGEIPLAYAPAFR